MRTFILVLHLMLTLSMIVVILFQRSEGDGMGLGGRTMGGIMSARGTANLLTRLTALLAAHFIGTNLFLAILARYETQKIIVLVSLPSPPTESSAPPPCASPPASEVELCAAAAAPPPPTFC